MQNYILYRIATIVTFGIIASRLIAGDPDYGVVKENKQRKALVIATNITIYPCTFIGLNELWYKNYNKSSFHFFDDRKEWLQMDKMGHSYSTYWLSRATFETYSWAGFDKRSAIAIAASSSWVFVSSVEVFDGFSSHWGASLSDLGANTIGTALFLVQQVTLNSHPITLKYSYYPSHYASKRPDILGANIPQRLLKDYNAQTYWMSVNLKATTSIDKLPPWLNIALGYGAEGMLSGNEDDFVLYPNERRYRQYYLSLDIDLQRIKTKNKVLKRILWLSNMVKIPFFSLEFSKHGSRIVVR